MTIETRRRKAVNSESRAGIQALPVMSAIDRLRQRGTTSVLRRGQAIPLNASNQSVTLVLEGVAVVVAGTEVRNRSALRLIYPGEMISADALPQIEAVGAIAAARTTVVRIAREKLIELISNDAEASRYVAASEARSMARQSLHIARLAMLSAEERLASLMYELAIALGSARGPAPFEMPMSRREMAAYLGINADTLSRLMSRLKARGLVTFTGRSRAMVPSPEKLATASPLSPSIRALLAAA